MDPQLVAKAIFVGVENGQWGLSEFTEVRGLYRSRSSDGLNMTTVGLVS